MISVEISTALLLYLGGFLFLCLGIWTFSHFRNRKRVILPPPYKLITCEYCSHDYLTPSDTPVSTCPQCHCHNRVPQQAS
ncbi:MAG: hypothetical protein K940chlam9_00916 [Chlamydiae bacterium]|nr:hypothetical protein [Chlamydiota bacterium]